MKTVWLMILLFVLAPVVGCGPKVDRMASEGGVSQQEEDPEAYDREQTALLRAKRR